MRYFFPLLLCMTVIGCQPDKESNIIPEEKMEKIIWELIEADEWAIYQYPLDTTTRKKVVLQYYQQVFQINKVSKDEFKKSYTYYSNHPKLLGPVLDSMRNRALPAPVDESATPRPKKPFKVM